MNWYKGDISQAVIESRLKNAIFVVFITGNDEASSRLLTMIDDTRIRAQLESEHFVAIRIESPSQAYVQFASIYKIAPVPSIFFIGKSGVPIEIGTSVINTAYELEGKINRALEVHLTKTMSSCNKSSLSAPISMNKKIENAAHAQQQSKTPETAGLTLKTHEQKKDCNNHASFKETSAAIKKAAQDEHNKATAADDAEIHKEKSAAHVENVSDDDVSYRASRKSQSSSFKSALQSQFSKSNSNSSSPASSRTSSICGGRIKSKEKRTTNWFVDAIDETDDADVCRNKSKANIKIGTQNKAAVDQSVAETSTAKPVKTSNASREGTKNSCKTCAQNIASRTLVVSVLGAALLNEPTQANITKQKPATEVESKSKESMSADTDNTKKIAAEAQKSKEVSEIPINLSSQLKQKDTKEIFLDVKQEPDSCEENEQIDCVDMPCCAEAKETNKNEPNTVAEDSVTNLVTPYSQTHFDAESSSVDDWTSDYEIQYDEDEDKLNIVRKFSSAAVAKNSKASIIAEIVAALNMRESDHSKKVCVNCSDNAAAEAQKSKESIISNLNTKLPISFSIHNVGLVDSKKACVSCLEHTVAEEAGKSKVAKELNGIGSQHKQQVSNAHQLNTKNEMESCFKNEEIVSDSLMTCCAEAKETNKIEPKTKAIVFEAFSAVPATSDSRTHFCAENSSGDEMTSDYEFRYDEADDKTNIVRKLITRAESKNKFKTPSESFNQRNRNAGIASAISFQKGGEENFVAVEDRVVAKPLNHETHVASELTPAAKERINNTALALAEYIKASSQADLSDEKTTESDCELHVSDEADNECDEHVERERKHEHALKKIKSNIRYKRAEEEKARVRIRALIAADRAEQAQRLNAMTNAEPVPVKKYITPIPAAKTADEVRLQFRFLNGDTSMHTFAMQDTIANVRRYVTDTLLISNCDEEFTLSTVYPRHVFTIEEEHKTLVSLGLHPSAVILVLFKPPASTAAANTASHQNNVEIFKSFFMSMVSSLLSAFNYMKEIIFSFFGGKTNASDDSAANVLQEQSSDDLTQTQAAENAKTHSLGFPAGPSTSHNTDHRYGQKTVHCPGDKLKDSDDENATRHGN